MLQSLTSYRSISGKYRRFLFLTLVILLIATIPAPAVQAQGDPENHVITIYFGGTGLPSAWWEKAPSRFNQPHVLALLHRYHKTSETDHQYKHWVDGVGAETKCLGPALVPFTAAQAQQQYPHNIWLFAPVTNPFPPFLVAFCWNWSQSLMDGLYYFDARLAELHDGDSITLNVLGNSRGGISSMWFLHRIIKKYDVDTLDQKIRRINIIAIDPVPGVNMVTDNYGDIEVMGGKSVFDMGTRLTNYVGIYAQDERTREFGPLVPKHNETTTRALMFRVRGSHETLVGNRQLNGHSVSGGILNESDENEGLRSVSDIVAVTAIELLTSPEWGGVEFANDLLTSVYPDGRSPDQHANREVLGNHVWKMNAAEDYGVDWQLARSESFVPLFLTESWNPVNECHGGVGGDNSNEPRCTLLITEDDEGSLRYEKTGLEWLVDTIPLIDDDELGAIWNTIRIMGYGDDDNDNVANDVDNCPMTANTDQKDEDQDGEGDACDPVADASGPYVYECDSPAGFDVQLDGSGSYDPDGELVSYIWNVNGQVLSGKFPPKILLPLAAHVVKLTVTDDDGYHDTDQTTATVEDTIGPVITGISEPIYRWPPNHKYETFTIMDFVSAVSDTCTVLTLDDLLITQVSSTQPDSGVGDGNTTDDVVIAPDHKSVDLRIERAGRDQVRSYIIKIQAVDGSGNTTTESFEVRIELKPENNP